MPPFYELRVYNVAGSQTALITDALDLNYVKRVNEPGLLTFTLPRGHDATQYLIDKAQVEVWRADDSYSITPYCDFYGMVRKMSVKGLPTERLTVTCPGQMSMLGWRTVNFRAAVANRSLFTARPAEEIMKNLVTYNATTSATVANSRISDGTWADRTITIQAGTTGGNTRDWECTQKNLLGTLKDLSRVAGGDYDLVKTAASTWDFRFYSGQLGTDRTASVIISEERGNMANAELIVDRSEEKTVAIVGGQGEKANKTYVTELGTNYSTSNKIEMYVDGSSYSTTAGLTATGQSALYQQQAKTSLSFQVLQTPNTLYGVNYVLGDLVTVEFDGTTYTQKVSGVTVTWKPSGGGGTPEMIVPSLTNV